MRADTRAALDLIEHLRRRGKTIPMTAQTNDELARMGIRPADFGINSVIAKYPEGATVICPYATRPLMLPNNKTSRCAECRTPIQHRPNIPKTVKKVCSPCGLRMVRGDA